MKKHEYAGGLPVRWSIWGESWWFNFQRLEVDGDIAIYGVKLGPLALYFRWNIPEKK